MIVKKPDGITPSMKKTVYKNSRIIELAIIFLKKAMRNGTLNDILWGKVLKEIQQKNNDDEHAIQHEVGDNELDEFSDEILLWNKVLMDRVNKLRLVSHLTNQLRLNTNQKKQRNSNDMNEIIQLLSRSSAGSNMGSSSMEEKNAIETLTGVMTIEDNKKVKNRRKMMKQRVKSSSSNVNEDITTNDNALSFLNSSKKPKTFSEIFRAIKKVQTSFTTVEYIDNDDDDEDAEENGQDLFDIQNDTLLKKPTRVPAFRWGGTTNTISHSNSSMTPKNKRKNSIDVVSALFDMSNELRIEREHIMSHSLDGFSDAFFNRESTLKYNDELEDVIKEKQEARLFQKKAASIRLKRKAAHYRVPPSSDADNFHLFWNKTVQQNVEIEKLNSYFHTSNDLKGMHRVESTGSYYNPSIASSGGTSTFTKGLENMLEENLGMLYNTKLKAIGHDSKDKTRSTDSEGKSKHSSSADPVVPLPRKEIPRSDSKNLLLMRKKLEDLGVYDHSKFNYMYGLTDNKDSKDDVDKDKKAQKKRRRKNDRTRTGSTDQVSGTGSVMSGSSYDDSYTSDSSSEISERMTSADKLVHGKEKVIEISASISMDSGYDVINENEIVTTKRIDRGIDLGSSSRSVHRSHQHHHSHRRHHHHRHHHHHHRHHRYPTHPVVTLPPITDNAVDNRDRGKLLEGLRRRQIIDNDLDEFFTFDSDYDDYIFAELDNSFFFDDELDEPDEKSKLHHKNRKQRRKYMLKLAHLELDIVDSIAWNERFDMFGDAFYVSQQFNNWNLAMKMNLMDSEPLTHPIQDSIRQSSISKSLKGRWIYDTTIKKKQINVKNKKMLTTTNPFKAHTKNKKKILFPVKKSNDCYSEIIFDPNSRKLLITSYANGIVLRKLQTKIECLFITYTADQRYVSVRTTDTKQLPDGYLGCFTFMQWSSIELEINLSLLNYERKMSNKARLQLLKRFTERSNDQNVSALKSDLDKKEGIFLTEVDHLQDVDLMNKDDVQMGLLDEGDDFINEYVAELFEPHKHNQYDLNDLIATNQINVLMQFIQQNERMKFPKIEMHGDFNIESYPPVPVKTVIEQSLYANQSSIRSTFEYNHLRNSMIQRRDEVPVNAVIKASAVMIKKREPFQNKPMMKAQNIKTIQFDGESYLSKRRSISAVPSKKKPILMEPIQPFSSQRRTTLSAPLMRITNYQEKGKNEVISLNQGYASKESDLILAGKRNIGAQRVSFHCDITNKLQNPNDNSEFYTLFSPSKSSYAYKHDKIILPLSAFTDGFSAHGEKVSLALQGVPPATPPTPPRPPKTTPRLNHTIRRSFTTIKSSSPTPTIAELPQESESLKLPDLDDTAALPAITTAESPVITPLAETNLDSERRTATATESTIDTTAEDTVATTTKENEADEAAHKSMEQSKLIILIESRRVMQLYFAKKFLQLNVMVNVHLTAYDATESLEANPDVYGLIFISCFELQKHGADKTLKHLIPRHLDRSQYSIIVYDMNPDDEDLMKILEKHQVSDILEEPYALKNIKEIIERHRKMRTDLE